MAEIKKSLNSRYILVWNMVILGIAVKDRQFWACTPYDFYDKQEIILNNLTGTPKKRGCIFVECQISIVNQSLRMLREITTFWISEVPS